VGTSFWQPLVEWLRNTVREKHCIDDQDLQRFRMMDAPEEIADYLDQVIDGRGQV
jgi:predicted Rossmann-fold nucleotide-binding protein